MTTTPHVIPDVTLAELVTERPARAAVLDRLGLDYCCHGQRPLAEACADAGLDAAGVLAALDAAATDGAPEAPAEPAALADHIESTHHRYLHDELPTIGPLAEKVATVHGARHPELAEVRDAVDELVADLEPHLLKGGADPLPGDPRPHDRRDRLPVRVDPQPDPHDVVRARPRRRAAGPAAPAHRRLRRP